MNISSNKRGQVAGNLVSNKFLNFIIGIAVLFFVAAAVIPVAQEAGDELGEADACTDAGCAFDNPVGFCAINSSSEGASISCPNPVRSSIPLSSLFAGGGIVFILVAVFLLSRAIKGPGK